MRTNSVVAVTASSVAILAIAAVLAFVVLRGLPFGNVGGPLPTGLFAPHQPVEMCVAVELGEGVVSGGSATIYWWSVSAPDCSNRSSGITRSPASVTTVSLPSLDELPPRPGFRVSFVVGIIPSGTREISLTLDPEFASHNGLDLAALRQGEESPTLTFTRVEELSIPGPGDAEPVVTPLVAPRE